MAANLVNGQATSAVATYGSGECVSRVETDADIARHFAAFVANTTYDDLPKSVVDTTKRVLLDIVGAAIAGSHAIGADVVHRQVVEWGGAAQSSILVGGQRVPAPQAAFVNGVFCHSVEYDDLHDTAHVHSFSVVFPAAMAAAELVGGVDGRQLITAMTLGAEIMCRLGLSMDMEKGWHGTSSYGVYGAAAAAAKIMGLDEEQTLNALGVASSQSAGTRQPSLDGRLTKRMHPGFAASDGVASAVWAQLGITGSTHPFEGGYGHYHVYEDRIDNRGLVLDGLGVDYAMQKIRLKPYPACGYTHAPLDAAMSLYRSPEFDVDALDRVEVVVSEVAKNLVGGAYEGGVLGVAAAQFSVAFTAANIFRFGRLSLSSYDEASRSDPVTAEIAKKIHTRSDPSIPSRDTVPVSMRATMKDGRVLESTIDHTRGDDVHPLTPDEVKVKLEDCLQFAQAPKVAANAAAIADIVNDLESVADVESFFALLS